MIQSEKKRDRQTNDQKNAIKCNYAKGKIEYSYISVYGQLSSDVDL